MNKRKKKIGFRTCKKTRRIKMIDMTNCYKISMELTFNFENFPYAAYIMQYY